MKPSTLTEIYEHLLRNTTNPLTGIPAAKSRFHAKFHAQVFDTPLININPPRGEIVVDPDHFPGDTQKDFTVYAVEFGADREPCMYHNLGMFDSIEQDELAKLTAELKEPMIVVVVSKRSRQMRYFRRETQ